MHSGGDPLFDDRPAKRIKAEAPPPPRENRLHDVNVGGSPYCSPRSLVSQAFLPPAGVPRPPPLPPTRPDLGHIDSYHRQLSRPSHQHEHAAHSASIHPVAAPLVADMPNPWLDHSSALFDSSWKWPPSYTTMPPPSSHLASALEPSVAGLHLDAAAHFFPAPLKPSDPDVSVAISQGTSSLPHYKHDFLFPSRKLPFNYVATNPVVVFLVGQGGLCVEMDRAVLSFHQTASPRQDIYFIALPLVAFVKPPRPSWQVKRAYESNLPPASSTRGPPSLASSLPPKRPRFSLPEGSSLGDFRDQVEDRQSQGGAHALGLVSPFKDCVGNFGEAQQRRFNRPFDGKVNGYIKFNWPKDRFGKSPSAGRRSFALDSSSVAESIALTADADTPQSSLIHRGSASASMTASPDLESNVDFPSFLYGPAPSFELSHRVEAEARGVSVDSSNDWIHIGAPQKVPKLFGYEAQMDHTDRKFWTFYIKNWCPGRSVLLETNLWLKDFAQMHKSDGVRAAIQSLAGIYIYDYQPTDSIRRRVNARFFEAEQRFSHLLNNPNTVRSEAHANELITMAVILSMQDIVLTERRLRKPHNPRWLSGFKQGELFLQATDHGARFWKRSNAQFSSLRNSQSIIVGRAMILAQPMIKLPSPDTFDPEYETSRFGWLLYGTERDMYQIHGGCGFSKKLLHMMSQITYCAARLQQDPDNIVIPTTSQYLHAELTHMRQWSSESKDWESAKAGPSITEWVRSVAGGFVISSSSDMTDVTAEAWRLTAIVYLQCRVLRIPRSHPAVVENLADLARCIRIMPTSGYQFTAQAPLFPVFLLGLLATKPDHKEVSRAWFDDVVSTPVRSSVPPLYEVLQRIWTWIDAEIEFSDADLAEQIGRRSPWWERLVEQIDAREHEVLCLT